MKKLEEVPSGDAEGFPTSTRVEAFELSAFSGLNGGLGAVAITAAGRLRPVAALEGRRSPECLLTGIVTGRSRPSTVGQSVQKNSRKADTESR